MAKVNCKQVAERLGVSYVVAAGIVKYFVASGKATLVEKVLHASGKGKPVRFYEIADSATLDLSEPVCVAPVADTTDVAEAA